MFIQSIARLACFLGRNFTFGEDFNSPQFIRQFSLDVLDAVQHQSLGLCLAPKVIYDATRQVVIERARDGACAQLCNYHVMYVKLADVQARLANCADMELR